MKKILKNIWIDFKPAIILMAIAIPLGLAAFIMAARGSNSEPIRLTVPDAGDVTACYYIPDLAKPYEQVWLGGEKLEAVLAELAATEFVEAEEDPDEETFRAALVIATNEEQITVHTDGDDWAWVFYEGRWLCERR